MKKPTVAICYDFDGTLSPKNMQEFGFFHGLDDKARKTFWDESNGEAKRFGADQNLMYMRHMIEKAEQSDNEELKATRDAFHGYGKSITYFEGVESWFDRIKDYAAQHGVILEHYIISSGLKEMIEGSSIGKAFKKIYACSFIYDKHGVAKWPCQVVNCTSKTQYLFRINKGIEDDSDTTQLNAYVPPEERPVPFSRMIYIGDGSTDVPCMRLVKDQGGTSIAVYKPRAKGKKEAAEKLYQDKRVNYIIPADYTEGSSLDQVVKRLIDRVAVNRELEKLAVKLNPAKKTSEKDGSEDAGDKKISAKKKETPAVELKNGISGLLEYKQ